MGLASCVPTTAAATVMSGQPDATARVLMPCSTVCCSDAARYDCNYAELMSTRTSGTSTRPLDRAWAGDGGTP